MDLNSFDSSVAHTLIEVHRESSKTLAVRASLQFTKFYLANLVFGQLLKDMRASLTIVKFYLTNLVLPTF
jgi:hypothetical protein